MFNSEKLIWTLASLMVPKQLMIFVSNKILTFSQKNKKGNILPVVFFFPFWTFSLLSSLFCYLCWCPVMSHCPLGAHNPAVIPSTSVIALSLWMGHPPRPVIFTVGVINKPHFLVANLPHNFWLDHLIKLC